MLKQRILTALVLLPLMIGMLFLANSPVWAAFTGLIALLALWEYSRLCHMSVEQQVPYLAISCIVGVCLYVSKLIGWPEFYVVIPLFWFIVVPLWLKYKWTLRPNVLAMAVGWLLILPFWQALIWFRPDTDHTFENQVSNALPLLLLMSMVWIADISAYFIGRAIGRHKLAPVISPNKSWEGAIGAVICVSVYAVAIGHKYMSKLPWWLILLIAIVITIVSILGDLLESWLKRAANIKDSSQLLPGHGGVLDRVDSLIAVLGICFSAFMLMVTFF